MRALLVAAAAACAVTAAPAPTRRSPLHQAIVQLFAAARRDAGPAANPMEFFAAWLRRAHLHVATTAAYEHKVARMGGVPHLPRFTQPSVTAGNHSYYPANGTYFAVIPEYVAAAVPGGAPVSFASGCLQTNVATATWNGDGSVSFNVTSSSPNPSAPGCSDFYLLGTSDTVDLLTVTAAGSQAANLAVTRKSWVSREGVRIFRFIHDPLTTLTDAVNTISLFVPSLTEPTLDAGSQQRNLDFLSQYVGISMPPRAGGTIAMDWSYVQSGDIMVVQRLDGLGTMEQWGTGASSTHIVMALRLGPNNDLYMVESTAKDAYWPLDNIQMNAIATWLPMAEASAYAIVHLPLSDAARASWNQAAAEAFIFDNLGYPYGYHNFINTFADVLDQNLPWPASWQVIEVIFNLLEQVDSNLTSQLITQALNMRLGTTGLDLVQAADAAAALNMTMADLIGMPEQDSWVYADGPSMVCDVFACNILKTAGVLGDPAGPVASAINCREFHNLDLYRLNIFNMTAARPQACVDADPGLPYCQIMGDYTILLTGVNSYEPYAHMNEHCGALPLNYTRMPTFQC